MAEDVGEGQDDLFGDIELMEGDDNEEENEVLNYLKVGAIGENNRNRMSMAGTMVKKKKNWE
jgi:hypothetical protein